MAPFSLLRRLISPEKAEGLGPVMLPLEAQVEAWRAAAKRMKWAIGDWEFEGVGAPPALGERDLALGFEGVGLFYGFGGDGSADADPVLSGRLAWQYALRRARPRPWQSPHVDFDRPDFFRLRPGAPRRPRGFYLAKIQTGRRHLGTSVARARKSFNAVTGCGPEGFQFLCVTHVHFQRLMDERRFPFMALADYDVAPHGFGDFFDAPHLFSGSGVLGLGIGNLEQVYKGVGIPTVMLETEGHEYAKKEAT